MSAVGTEVPTSGYFLSGASAIGRWLAEENEAPRRVAGPAGRTHRGHIQRAAHAASAQLAAERGPFPAFAESTFATSNPIRHAQLTSVAPTGTISLIAGTTAGIEPMFAIAYTRAVLGRHLAAPRTRCRSHSARGDDPA